MSMDTFIDSLVATGKNGQIPEEYNLFAPLIGTWDFECVDVPEADPLRRMRGE